MGMLVCCTQFIRIVGTGLAFRLCPVSGLGKLVLISAPLHVSFANASGTLLIANFRMLFSSSEEPNTASMAACLALIFESIQESVDHSLRSSRRYVTSTGCV